MRLSILFEGGGHKCRFDRRDPGDSDWARRNARFCPVCAAEYDAELDAGFVGDVPEPRAEEPSVSPGDFLSRLLARDDPRRSHEPGRFGTGRVRGVDPDDSLMVAALKLWRDKGIKVNPVTGEPVVPRDRDKCGFKHTCGFHPSGRPAWNYPLPDPVATRKTGLQRYNYMFEYSPTSTFEWPVSGMMGYKPKSEYLDYVKSKLECPVCSGEVEGCDKPVAQEYSSPKPFCSDHLELSPYPRELLGRFPEGLPGDPGPGDPGYGEVEREWVKARSGFIRPGDRVQSGKQVGVLLEVDPEMEDRTHRVRWDNPRSEALRVTWVDPKSLDLV